MLTIKPGGGVLNNNMLERVAIIMPVYNCASTVERAIQSVISQSYSKWHIYIINDCSSDNTLEIIKKYQHHDNVSIINNHKNLGVALSRNKGIEASNEKVIAFLDGDDEWLEHKLEAQMKEISKGAQACITEYKYISTLNKTIRWRKDILNGSDFLKKNYRVCFSSLLHIKLDNVRFKNTGHEDFIYIYELISELGDLKFLNETLVNYYSLEGSLSSNKLISAKWHWLALKKICKNKPYLTFNFFFYVFNALKFKFIKSDI